MRLLPALALTVAACAPRPSDPGTARTEVLAALARYQAAARAVDAAGVAASFAPDGMLFEPGIHPIRTPDSIRAFMGSFPGVRVDSATAEPDTIEEYGGQAYIWGRYFEQLAFPGQPYSTQHGRFVMHWARQADGTWLLRRYFRIPIPSPPASALPR